MNLAEVLDRATDRLEQRGLAGVASAVARQRRARRRIVTGAVATVVVVTVGTMVGVAGLPGERRGEGPVGPGPGPTQDSSVSTVLPPSVDPDAIGDRWDPFTVTDAPLRPSILPELLAPPATTPRGPSLAEQPMDAAVLAWPEAGHDLAVLGTDGLWRSVPGTRDAVAGTLDEVVRPAISADGRQVAMSTNDGILVVDVSTGDQRTIPWPAGPLARRWDTAPHLIWVPGGAGFLVLHWQDTWLVTLGGEARRAPYGGAYGGGLAVDPGGTVVEKRFDRSDLRVWRGDAIVSTADVGYWGERLVAGHDRVALTGGGNGLPGHGGPLVLDAADGDLLGYLPVRDPSSVYSDNGHLTALGFLDRDTVLLRVGPAEFGPAYDPAQQEWHLVAWNFDSGAIERLTTGGPAMADIVVAVDVLARTS